MTNPICSTCKDTHRISGAYNSCTSCPIPCQKCRVNMTPLPRNTRTGLIMAYCRSTPCNCLCHKDHYQYANKISPTPREEEMGRIEKKIADLDQQLDKVRAERDRLMISLNWYKKQ